MTAPDRASRRLFAALPSPELTRPVEEALRDLRPGGLTLFSRNFRSIEQTRALVAGIRELCGADVLIAVDLEGGPVNRLSALDPRLLLLPPAETQRRWPDEKTMLVWAEVGAALVALGLDIDFAPVVDLAGPAANGIGPRAFGADPAEVIRAAGLVLDGLLASGVLPCLKHFPGLGETDLDTHHGLATCLAPARRLLDRHVGPFRALSARAPLVMMAHAHYPSVVGERPLPAGFSEVLVRQWLRERLGYEGVIVTDDLGMGAVRGFGDPAQLAARGLGAGADVALFCHDLDAPRRARDGLVDRLAAGDLDPAAHAASIARIGSLRPAGGPLPGAVCSAAIERLVRVISA